MSGDAVTPSEWKPVPPENWECSFDAAIAVDAAYHFKNRELFLRLCFERILKPGGRIGLADIIAGPGYRQFCQGKRGEVLHWVLKMLGFPRENLWQGVDEYRTRMTWIGFKDIQVQDISDGVFPGFVRFLERFDTVPHPWGFQERAAVLGFAIFREVMRWMAKNKIIAFVVVNGTKSCKFLRPEL